MTTEAKQPKTPKQEKTFTPDADGFYDMEAAKTLGTPGLRFRAPTGATGTVLEERSPKGKLRAELTCIKGGPNHIREVSDWHQCGVSPEMKKKAKKKAKVTVEQTVEQAEAVRVELEAKLVEARTEAGLSTEQTVTA